MKKRAQFVFLCYLLMALCYNLTFGYQDADKFNITIDTLSDINNTALEHGSDKVNIPEREFPSQKSSVKTLTDNKSDIVLLGDRFAVRRDFLQVTIAASSDAVTNQEIVMNKIADFALSHRCNYVRSIRLSGFMDNKEKSTGKISSISGICGFGIEESEFYAWMELEKLHEFSDSKFYHEYVSAIHLKKLVPEIGNDKLRFLRESKKIFAKLIHDLPKEYAEYSQLEDQVIYCKKKRLEINALPEYANEYIKNNPTMFMKEDARLDYLIEKCKNEKE